MSVVTGVQTLWGREPVLVLGVLQAALALGVSFGLHLSTAQVGGIVAFSASVLAFATRQQVTPNGSGAVIPPQLAGLSPQENPQP